MKVMKVRSLLSPFKKWLGIPVPSVMTIVLATMIGFCPHSSWAGPGFLWPRNHLPEPSLILTPNNTLQVSVILPNKSDIPDIMAAQRSAGMGILVGFQTASKRGLLSQGLYFNVTFRDSGCDITRSSWALFQAGLENVDVVFGPSCEYALGKSIFCITCGGCLFNLSS